MIYADIIDNIIILDCPKKMFILGPIPSKIKISFKKDLDQINYNKHMNQDFEE